MILPHQIVQVLAGPHFCLSRQESSGLQFGDSTMRCLVAVERDLLWHLIVCDGVFEEALRSRFISICLADE
jgi:hypothetical protein